MTRPDYRNSPTLRRIEERKHAEWANKLHYVPIYTNYVSVNESELKKFNDAIKDAPRPEPPQHQSDNQPLPGETAPLSFLNRIRNCWRNLFHTSANHVTAKSKVNDVP